MATLATYRYAAHATPAQIELDPGNRLLSRGPRFRMDAEESFDLKQNVFRDDRRDVLASTRAALDDLEQLLARFGDWHLALAAYNWGQGNVIRAISRNQKDGRPTASTGT